MVKGGDHITMESPWWRSQSMGSLFTPIANLATSLYFYSVPISKKGQGGRGMTLETTESCIITSESSDESS